MNGRLTMNITIVVVAIIIGIIAVRDTAKKQKRTYSMDKRKKLHNRYVFYYNNVLLRSRFKRIVTQFSTISCYTFEQVQESSVKLFEKAVGVSLIMPFAALGFTRDVLITILVSFIAYVYYNITIEKEIDKINETIIKQISEAIQSIRDKYLSTDNILTAVLFCEKGEYVAKSIMHIYEALASVNSENALYEFCRTMPVRIIKTLAIVCHILYIYGDDKNVKGESAFAEVLTSIRQEADFEIRRMQKTRIAFKSLSMLAIAGLAITPLIDMFLLAKIPGTAVLVKGMYGNFVKIIVVIVTVVAYYLISIFSKASTVNQVDKIEFIDNLSKNPKVKKFINCVKPKKFKTKTALQKRVRNAISSKSFDYIYTSKVATSMIAFVVGIVFLAGFTVASKSALWNNFNTLSFASTNEGITEVMYGQLKKVDRIYMTAGEKMKDEEAAALVKSYMRNLTGSECSDQVTRLSTKWDKYYAMGFKWYYVVLVYVFGILGWFTPEISLELRKTLVQYEAAEDVAQIQTVMSAISKTSADVLTSLYWMEKVSDNHKAPLRYAYHEYTSDPEGALDKLSSKVGSSELKNIVSKLKSAVYSLSMQESFSDMLMNKEQSLILRETLRGEVLESKTQYARLLATNTTFIAIILGLLGPLFILGFESLTSAFSMIP